MKHSHLCIGILLVGFVISGCSQRSIGNSIDDQFIGPEVASAIEKSDPDLTSPTARIVAESYNGVVLLAGQIPRTQLRETATRAAQSVSGVVKVRNELRVQMPISLLVRTNDALITSKIKAIMVADEQVPSGRVKVITENGITYLMGIVTHQEGTHAAAAAGRADGVQKVVKLFEYLN